MGKDARNLKGKTGIVRLINAMRYSYEGISATLRSEQAFRQEFYLAVILGCLVFFVPVSALWRFIAIAASLFVLVVELLNTGIEATIDRIGPEIHPLSKFAKDVASAAVFFSLIVWGGAWAFLLYAAFFA